MKANPLSKRYYRTLGLKCDASAEEIREAYYQLAFTHHPDRNPGDAYAAARFKKIQSAYEWLSQRWGAPPPTAEQFPFITPERSQAGLFWQGLAALAGVAALAVTLTVLLRVTPRMGAAVKTESPRLEQLPSPSHFATKPHQPVKVPDKAITAARGSLTARSSPDNKPLRRSAAGKLEWLAESWEGSLLESVEGSFPVSFSTALDAARDAVCMRPLSPEMHREAGHTSPSWQETLKHGLPFEPTPLTRTVSERSTRPAREENDQQVLIEDKMIRFGDRGRESASLGKISPRKSPPSSPDFDSLDLLTAYQPEGRQWPITPFPPELEIGALQPAARQLEPRSDIPGKWSGERQSLLPLQPLERTLPRSYESGNSGNALQMPSKNSHPPSPELLGRTTFPNYQDHSDLGPLNLLEKSSSELSSNAWKSLPLLPIQPPAIPSWQTEKVLGHLREPQHGRQPANRAQSTAKADAMTWGANSTQNAWPLNGMAAGNALDSMGSFTQNGIRGLEGDFGGGVRRGPKSNFGWNSQQGSAASSNFPSTLTRPETRKEKNYFLPRTHNADASRRPYGDPAALPGNQRSLPTLAPYGNGRSAPR